MTGGQYYSAALLNAMLSHSVRWCKAEPGMQELLAPFDEGKVFFQTAVTNLFDDIRNGQSKVPTVQSLLLLSAQECGRGNRTQAWLYSGMAFRLIDDMGMCIDGQRYADSTQFSAEDVEIRNRLFWGCYLWDKLVSLYFGRSPMLQNSHVSPPRVISKLFYYHPGSFLRVPLTSLQWTTLQRSRYGCRMASQLPTIHPDKHIPSHASYICAVLPRY